MPTMILCPPDQLRIHPQNMRRFYPEADVAEMARSIQASSGVVQALLVVPDPDRSDGYLVVDGNMRLAGARLLGADCPPLKCELISASHAEQLLLMATTSALHYPKDPISEGLHYRRLLDQGYSVQAISQHTGISHATVSSRLRLLDLDAEIQEQIAGGRLSRDHRVADALLSVPDPVERTKLAARLAARNASITTCVNACQKLVEQMRQRDKLLASRAPALALARDGDQPPDPRARAGWDHVRAGAAAACQACAIHQETLAGRGEPAWELISHAASDTCAACNLRELKTLCGECPAVELLRRLGQAVSAKAPAISGGLDDTRSA